MILSMPSLTRLMGNKFSLWSGPGGICSAFRVVLTVVGAMAWTVVGGAEGVAPADIEYFESRVRPLLAEHCLECHSERTKIKGGLALDSRGAWEKGGDTGPAIHPGEVDKSLLVRAVRRVDASLEMPPKKPLSSGEVAVLEEWVRRGAPDPRDAVAGVGAAEEKARQFEEGRKHWAYQPPRRPALPSVKDVGWPRTGVDRFILAALEGRDLRPVAPAGKRELIRRATFDVTGLPPTPEEVDAFLADDAPRAFERVVDRLLASPGYGERWGRHWLDVARYAEDQAHTFGVKPNSNGYRYRDWVIDALNRDMPYNEFVFRQIAGDQMGEAPEVARQQVAALGFFGLGAVYYKNSDAAKAAADELDDRIDTLTRGFLGLTVSCARCHDHKYDPIPTQDYYSLAGVFRSSELSNAPLVEEAEVRRYDEAQAGIKKLEEGLKLEGSNSRMRLALDGLDNVPAYVQAAWAVNESAKLPKPRNPAQTAKAAQLEEPQLRRWMGLLARNKSGGFASMRPMVELPSGLAASAEIAGLPAPAGSAVEGSAAPVPVLPEVPEPVLDAAVAVRENLRTVLAAIQAARAAAPGKPVALNGPAKEAEELFGDRGPLAVSEDELSARVPAYAEQKRGLEEAKKASPPMYPVAHVIRDAKPADMNVFVRGNPKNVGERAPRRFLRVLCREGEPTAFTKGSGRVELAEAVASAENPLTARVMVNRLWKHHFGRGLVGTPSNFGVLGEKPTHPELLDYLALRLVEEGWRLKAVHREILLSATYALGVGGDPRNEAVDADNMWRWRASRTRLDVESWRDALLSVSGRLDRAMGGPSTDLANAANNRRTVYARVSRHELDALLRLFDFPDANITCDKRTETTVPQQQLFVLNSPFMVEQAKAFAQRLLGDASARDDAARLQRAYLLAFGRPPSETELKGLGAYLAASDPEDTKAANKLSRWERLCMILLGSNEFYYLD